MYRRHLQKGFTLIELLVVIAIIGILASVVLASLSSAREKAQDSERMTEIKQVQSALEIYYTNNGRYPAVTTGNTYVSSIVGLAPTYIPVLPTDPVGTGQQVYRYSSDNYTLGYTLMVNLLHDSLVWCRISGGDLGHGVVAESAWASIPLCNS